MSNLNIVNAGNLDARYAKPADVTAAINTQAATDAGQYDSKMGSRVKTLQAKFSRIYEPLPATNPTPPTISHTTGGNHTLPKMTNPQQLADIGIIRSSVPNWNSTYSVIDIGARPTVLDFWINDNSVEIVWAESNANATLLWTWVDGMPAETVPTTPPLTTVQGGSYTTKLTWSTVARRRVQMHFVNTNSIAGLWTNYTGWIEPTGRLPKITLIGDSYVGGSTASGPPNGIADVLARALQAEVQNEGAGGTGYVNGGPYGTPFSDATRVARVTAFNPDLIVFFGSINDPLSGLQAAATSTYAAYTAACPKAPQIVIGVQPTGASTTISSAQVLTAKAIYDAATAAPNVIGFVDPIGYASTGTLPSVVYGSYNTLTKNSLYSYQGGVYKGLINGSTGPGVPGSSSAYQLLSWYDGTGNTTSPTGDGNRDAFVYGGDNTHPTTSAAYMFGLAIADSVVRTLANYVSA